MTELFGRKARIVIGAGLGPNIRVGLDVSQHRCAFRVERDLKPEPNTCTLRVWGLSGVQRGALEELRPGKGEKIGVPVSIEAGYETTGASEIYRGDLGTFFTVKEGAEIITTLESADGSKAVQTARINLSFGPKTSTETVLRAIVKALGIKPGNLNQAVGLLRKKGFASYPHGAVLSGSAAVYMSNFCKSAGLTWSIQRGALQLQETGKALGDRAVRLTSTTGLVESPCVDSEGVLSARCLMIPEIVPGVLVVVDSLSVKGNYLVQSTLTTADTHGSEWGVEITGTRY